MLGVAKFVASARLLKTGTAGVSGDEVPPGWPNGRHRRCGRREYNAASCRIARFRAFKRMLSEEGREMDMQSNGGAYEFELCDPVCPGCEERRFRQHRSAR